MFYRISTEVAAMQPRWGGDLIFFKYVMLRRLFISLLFVGFVSVGMAQNYTMDATLERIEGNYAVLKCSGIAANKKEAIEMAKKSAVYTYLYSGIKGLNNDRPLINGKPTRENQEYLDRIFNTTNYMNYIHGCYPAKDVTKVPGGGVQIMATVELFHESLQRTLERAGVLKHVAVNLDELTETIAMPTIMVVPFCQGDESYDAAIRKNINMRMAISKVNEGFISRGVETKDLLTCLANAETYRVRYPSMSLDDAILANSGADVSVSVDIVVENSADYGVRVSMTLRAVEVATGNTLATVAERSSFKRTTADHLCAMMAKGMIDGFMKQISERMIKKTSTGQSVSVRFVVDPSSAINMDTEINNIMPLSDILISWVKRHAKGGRYHTQGRTETMLVFSDIFIDNSLENGMQNDINDFALAIYQYLKGLNLTIKRTITGNSVDIIIY